MADIDLNSLSLPELKQLQKDVAKAVLGFDDRRKSEARAALEAQAKELGFTLAELTGTPVVRKRAEVQPKYCHPENRDITWSGRGRRPLWFVAAIEAGKSPESLSV